MTAPDPDVEHTADHIAGMPSATEAGKLGRALSTAENLVC